MARLVFFPGDTFTIGASNTVTEVFGSSGKDTITIAAGSKAKLYQFDASDAISLGGNASSYSASISGSTIVLTDALGGQVTIPVSTTAKTIVFGDASRDLSYNATTDKYTLGDQVIARGTSSTVTAGTGGGAAGQTFTLTAGVDSVSGGAGNDSIKADAAAKLGAFDNINGGDGTDTLEFTDLSLDPFTLSTSATVTGVENLVLSHTSNAAADIITLDTSVYSSLRSISVANIGTNIGAAGTNGVVITTESNVTSVIINGGASAQDIVDAAVSDSGAAADATTATTDALASVTLVGLGGAVAVASDALTAVSINAVAGLVTNTDGYVAATDARALTVTYDGGTNGGVTDAGATSVTVKASATVADIGTNTFAAATAVTVDNTGGGKITTGSLATAAAKTINIIADNAITLTGTVGATTVTALTISGDSKVTASGITTKASGVVTINDSASLTLAAQIGTLGTSGSVVNNSTGTVTLGSGTTTAGIDTTVAYTGGAGKDVLSVGATTKAITLGGGDDTLSLVGATIGTGGSIDAGDGNDTLVLTSANAATASATTTFEAKISNFEVVSLGATSTVGGDTIDVANLDDISNIKSAGGSTALTVNNLQATNLFTQTALTSAAVALNLTTTVGSSDVVNVKFEASAGFVNTGTITIAGVETVNVTTSDTSVSTDLTPTITAFTAPIAATSATSVVITGNAGIDLTGNTLSTVLASFDASGVTGYVATDGTNTAGAVKFTTGNLTVASALKGGAGDDVLNASAAQTAGKLVTIYGNDGNDALTGSATLASTLYGGAGDDTLTGGAGADTLDGGDGADRIVLGGGLDVVTGGAGNDTFVVAATGTTASAYGRITDAAAGDKIEFGANLGTETFASTKITLASTATFTDYLNAAAANTGPGGFLTNGAISWFQFNGNTYVVEDRSTDATFLSGTDILIQLDGLVSFTSTGATLGGTDGNVLTIG